MPSTNPMPPAVAALFARQVAVTKTAVAAQAAPKRAAVATSPPIPVAPTPSRYRRRGSVLDILV